MTRKCVLWSIRISSRIQKRRSLQNHKSKKHLRSSSYSISTKRNNTVSSSCFCISRSRFATLLFFLNFMLRIRFVDSWVLLLQHRKSHSIATPRTATKKKANSPLLSGSSFVINQGRRSVSSPLLFRPKSSTTNVSARRMSSCDGSNVVGKRDFNSISNTNKYDGGSTDDPSLPAPATKAENKVTSSNNNNNLVVVLAGPTGVGKSDIAAVICKSYHEQQQQKEVERSAPGAMIISADSVQAYRGVNIGANKPSMEERKHTPHILVDVVDHNMKTYNAADWRKDALYSISCLLRGRGTIDSYGNDENKNSDENKSYHYSDDNNYNNATGVGKEHPEIKKETNPDGKENYNEDPEWLERQQKERRQSILDSIQQAKLTKGYINDQTVVPIVVGGTMMYLQWLVHGRPDVDKPTEEVAKKAHDKISSFKGDGDDDDDYYGAAQYVASYGSIFKDRTEKLHGKDWYRLRRILEVAYTTIQQQQQQQKQLGNNITNTTTTVIEKKQQELLYTGLREGSLDEYILDIDNDGGIIISNATENKNETKLDVRCFFLCPDDRMNHTQLVDKRCEQMIIRGLIQETTDLLLSGELPDMATKAIGYRQTLEYLQRENPVDNDSKAFMHYIDQFTTATRRYAKKQMQWFRRDDKFLFVPISMPPSLNEVKEIKKKKDIKSCDGIDNEDNADIEISNDDNENKNVNHGKNNSRSEKAERVQKASGTIQHILSMSREEYDSKVSPHRIISEQIKENNEKQGKGMKFYQFQRHILKPGTKELQDALEQADVCTKQVQAMKKRKKEIIEATQ